MPAKKGGRMKDWGPGGSYTLLGSNLTNEINDGPGTGVD